MKKVLFSALAALALTGMGSAFAADPQDATVQIRASGDYKLGVGEFDDYAFTYGLSTGQKIKFTRTAGQHFYAQLKNQAREPMYAVSKGVFVTASGARVAFADDGLHPVAGAARLVVAVELFAAQLHHFAAGH